MKGTITIGEESYVFKYDIHESTNNLAWHLEMNIPNADKRRVAASVGTNVLKLNLTLTFISAPAFFNFRTETLYNLEFSFSWIGFGSNGICIYIYQEINFQNQNEITKEVNLLCYQRSTIACSLCHRKVATSIHMYQIFHKNPSGKQI